MASVRGAAASTWLAMRDGAAELLPLPRRESAAGEALPGAAEGAGRRGGCVRCLVCSLLVKPAEAAGLSGLTQDGLQVAKEEEVHKHPFSWRQGPGPGCGFAQRADVSAAFPGMGRKRVL